MEWKDIIPIIGLFAPLIGAMQIFKSVNWSLPKSAKFTYILENHKECLSDLEVKFAKKEIEREVRGSVLKVVNPKFREMILFIRTHSELTMPWWRWGHIAPHIQCENNRFFIRYKGKYLCYRWISKGAAILNGIIAFSVLAWSQQIAPFLGVVSFLACLFMAVMFWKLLPDKKVINLYNEELLSIDGDKFPVV